MWNSVYMEANYKLIRKGKHACTLHRQAQKWVWHKGRWYAPKAIVDNPIFDLK